MTARPFTIARATFAFATLALAVSGTALAAETIELRPDDPLAIKMGQMIYTEHCAACHGVNLEGQDGWRDTMIDGMRLAPTHDRSGHTSHHPDELLYNLTKYGFAAMIGRDYKVSMPIYDGVLKDDEIIAALSYIKSTSPDDVRQIHDRINADYKLNKTLESGKGS